MKIAIGILALGILAAEVGVGVAAPSAPSVRTKEGMPGMPRIQPKKSYTVMSAQEGKAILDQRGYGDQEQEVRMMNLMMVGGSGYEGMDMAAHEAPIPAEGQTGTYEFTSRISPDPPQVGANILEVVIQDKNRRQPVRGLMLKAQVYMTSMNMGTEEPSVTEVAPGRYQVKVMFSMRGPWAVRLLLPEGGEKIFAFDALKK